MSIRHLSDGIQQTAIRELNEVPSKIQESLKHIRDWAVKQPHLNIRKDDQWLLNFLRGCKFSLQKTKQKLDTFYSMRSLLPEFFTNRDPFSPEIQTILKLGLCIPLPKTDPEHGPRIIFIRAPIDPTNLLFVNMAKVCFMIIDILLNEDDNFVIAGQFGLIDCSRGTIGHLPYVDITVCKKAVVYLQQGYPIRPKGIFILNAPSYIEVMIHTVKTFLTRKLRGRVHIYKEKTANDVHKLIPLSLLPNEYGGGGGSLDELTDIWKKKVESYEDWFKSDAKHCADENKRVGNAKNSFEMFGIEGSFRKLEID